MGLGGSHSQSVSVHVMPRAAGEGSRGRPRRAVGGGRQCYKLRSVHMNLRSWRLQTGSGIHATIGCPAPTEPESINRIPAKYT